LCYQTEESRNYEKRKERRGVQKKHAKSDKRHAKNGSALSSKKKISQRRPKKRAIQRKRRERTEKTKPGAGSVQDAYKGKKKKVNVWVWIETAV